MSSVRTRYPAPEKLAGNHYLRRGRGGGTWSRVGLSHHFPTTSFLPTTGAPQQTTVARERHDLPEETIAQYGRSRQSRVNETSRVQDVQGPVFSTPVKAK
jgi:hypothetical protein